jgi:hypothetical protein
MEHDPGQPLDSPAGRRRARAVLAGAVLVVLAGAGLWAARPRRWLGPAPANRPEDPRRTYSGPFQNVHPDVAYVGDEKCAECHLDKALSYREHPMGRSLLPVSQVAGRQRYDAKAHNPFEAFGVLFRVERRGERVVHRQVGRDEEGRAVYEFDMPVHYALGSGTRGYSYLTDHDGCVFQSPVSWYSHKQIWDVSPGFSAERRSGRPVLALCLFCHANRVRPREGSINSYEEPLFEGHAIGCERCHGPGDLHVRERTHDMAVEGPADYTIVNPRHLEPELRAGVCEQCHLIGEARVVHRGRGLFDFRPGLPPGAFYSAYVLDRRSGGQKAVNHVEQMAQSKCFLRSEEKPAEGKRKLGCTSCHDPHEHVGPAKRVAHYRGRCLECHRSRGCSLPEEARRLEVKDDSCIDCHMPRYPPSDIAHTSATDHRIIRVKEKGEPAAPPRPGHETDIVSFYRRGADANDPDAERDLGLALVHVLVQRMVQGKDVSADVARRAAGLLEPAVRTDPDDLEAWEGKAEALALLDRGAEALATYEAVLAKAPRREVYLMGAAMLAQDHGQRAKALAYWRRAAEENPWQPYYRACLARMLAERRAWEEARPHCEAWVRLDPGSIEARVLWVRCLARSGEKARARAEFAKVERLRPSNLPQLRARFAAELRSR